MGAGVLVGNAAKGAALLEVGDWLGEAVAPAEQYGPLTLAAAFDQSVELAVIEGPVERGQGFNFRHQYFELGENFPVAHVGE